MGSRELRFLERALPWMRQRARRHARELTHTDTSEILSSAIGRLALVPTGDRPDDSAMLRSLVSTVIWQTAADQERRGKLRRAREIRFSRRPSVSDVSRYDTGDGELDERIRRLLSDDQYRVMHLTSLGMSSQKIAESEGLSPSTVRSKIASARAILRESFEANPEGWQ